MSEAAQESWDSGGAYELWVGRWSRRVAQEFIDWLAISPGQTWGDVGCGTGSLVECILGSSDPAGVLGVDRSEAYVSQARNSVGDSRVRYEVGDACALTWAPEFCDVTVSGLVLNFVPDADAMAREMVRVTRPGGRVAAYVWDYAGGMQMLRHFWDVALALNPGRFEARSGRALPTLSAGPSPATIPTRGANLGLSTRDRCPYRFSRFRGLLEAFLGQAGCRAHISCVIARREPRPDTRGLEGSPRCSRRRLDRHDGKSMGGPGNSAAQPAVRPDSPITPPGCARRGRQRCRGSIALLAEQPGIGAQYEGACTPGVRRLFLGRIGYFLCYRLKCWRFGMRVAANRHESSYMTPNPSIEPQQRSFESHMFLELWVAILLQTPASPIGGNRDGNSA